MNFSVVCLIGILTALPFGAAFALAPEPTSAIYGITGWNSGTTGIARLFGTELLYVAAALFAVRGVTDREVQRQFAIGFGLASALATFILIQAISSGAVNAMSWSSVAIYAFFTAAWASVAVRRDK